MHVRVVLVEHGVDEAENTASLQLLNYISRGAWIPPVLFFLSGDLVDIKIKRRGQGA